MPFITQGKTNWRLLLIVIILAIIVGGGALWYIKRPEKPYQPIEIKKTVIAKNIEVTDELANKIMDKVVPENYDRKTACFLAADLDNDNAAEIFIGALKTTPGNEGYLVVVRPTDESGDYKKIADITLSKEGNFITSAWGKKENILPGWLANLFCDKQIADGTPSFFDIDKDGKKEMILGVEQGANWVSYGIFKINWVTNKIEWQKIKNKDGSLENTYFVSGGGAGNPTFFGVKDLDSDGTFELIAQKEVYKWDGSIFNYDENLSTYWQSIDKLRVVTPNGGEKLKIGTIYTVEIYEPYGFGPEVSFQLYKTDGTRLGNLEGSRPSELKFEWKVGKYTYLEGDQWKTAIAPEGDNYLIGLLIPGNPNPVDLSDKPFRIYP